MPDPRFPTPVPIDALEPEPLDDRFYWKPYLPANALTLVTGDPSAVADLVADLYARVAKGEGDALPDGSFPPKGNPPLLVTPPGAWAADLHPRVRDTAPLLDRFNLLAPGAEKSPGGRSAGRSSGPAPG